MLHVQSTNNSYLIRISRTRIDPTKSPSITQTMSLFPSIWPHLLVIFTRLLRTLTWVLRKIIFPNATSKPVPATFDSVFLPTCLNAQNGCKKSKAYKVDKPCLAGCLEDLDPWLRDNLNISHLPLKLSFLANYLFFGPSLIVYKPKALASDIKATGRGLLTGYRWDT